MELNATLDSLNVRVISFLRVYPSSDWKVGAHSHSDFELHFITSGRGDVKIDGRSYRVEGNDLFITGPGVMHSQYTDPIDPMEEYCIECIINDEQMASELTRHKRVYKSDEITDIVLKLARECEDRSAYQDIKRHSLIFLLISKIYSLVCGDDNVKKQSKSIQSSHLERIVGFVDANYTKKLTLLDASKALYLCDRQINRIMKQELGKSFHEYVMDMRMQHAKRLLSEGVLSIEQVALASGYSSKFYMYQAFSRKGMAPPARHKEASPEQGEN